ncbi:MAG: AAA family ATPase [Alphaproteobacteria bacterium]|nr:AAA family ATPase [Alphaproteobacteria bacterium]
MDEQPEPVRLEDHSLDEIIQLLTAGRPVHRTKGGAFSLDTADKRKVFAFYGRNRDLWPRNKSVQSKEVESVLKALDGQEPAAVEITPRAGGYKPLWHLERVEAHRFGGLQRHLGPNGEDPDPFVFDLGKEITLISGFNGAGKTALLSAIIWCLTGKALRSQHMPREVHEPMAIEWSAETDGAPDTDSQPEIAIPPIVPIPSAENLAKLGDVPKLDTRVDLTFRQADTGEIKRVSRRLDTTGRKLVAPVEGLEGLGLSALAIEAGTLMPGVAAHMRFDEKSDFTQAVALLTGLKPLEELGQRTERLVNRLRTTEKRTTEEARDKKSAVFRKALQTLQEGWQEHADLGRMPAILLPGEEQENDAGGGADDQQQKTDCRSSIAAARQRLRELQTGMSAAMEAILGRRIELTTQQEVDAFTRALDEAADRLKGSALRELPSVVLLGNLGKITDEEADAALKAVKEIVERAQALSRRLEDERQAARWRLYSRVSAWHRDHHPDQDISNCPVCGTDLDEVPSDALLDLSVKAALDQCREADSDIAKTAAEWERDEAAAFLNVLPENLRGFADKAQQNALLDICRKGYVDELLAHKSFSGRLEQLRKNGQKVWDLASGEHPLPEAPKKESSALPALFASGKLQERLEAIACTIALRQHRLAATEALQSLMGRYIGKAGSPDDPAESSENESVSLAEDRPKPAEEPLREQIGAIRRAVQNAIPLVSLIRQLDELELVRQGWQSEEDRLKMLARAADAAEPFLEFPGLVYERVSGLIETLNRDTLAWLGKLYRSHYNGGPSYGGFEPGEDSGFGLRAELGDMRVPAHQVMNASLLRACVWAFLFALWEHISKQAGGLSCVLLDDPQTHFDPINSENLAAAIPLMPGHNMRALIASNDVRFVAAIQDKLPSRATDAPTWTALRLDPVSSSKLTATLSPALEEIREKRDRWREDENDTVKAQEFVKCVRVDIENRLWNLLATDPLVMHAPTLGDLLGQLRHARNGGERPFEEPPFEMLVTHEALRDKALFYKIINKAHHRPMDVTPQDAADVNEAYKNVHSTLRSCSASYARFMGRLTNEDRDFILADAPAAPSALQLFERKLPVLGSLAARSSADILAIAEDHEQFSLESLGAVALYAVRGPSLGSLALAGQVVIVSLDREPTEGEPVIALYKGKTFARRFHRDRKEPSRTVLAADLSGTERVPPVKIVPTAATRAMPVIGILYDAQKPGGQDEAAAVQSSDVLSRTLAVAHIVEDSAYPIVRDGDMVILEAITNHSEAAMNKLEGRIVALTARSGSESFGYLKRLGLEVSPGNRVYENIGLNGQAVCVSTGSATASGLVLERLWRVHGVLRLSGK